MKRFSIACLLLALASVLFPISLHAQDLGIRDTLAIKCPVVVPLSQLIPGDSFQVEVYIWNDERIYGVSTGFKYSSDFIEVTSVDVSGSVIPNAGSNIYRLFYPDNKQCLLGYASLGFDGGIPPRSQRGLLFKLNVKMLPGVTAEDVLLDTAFVAPAGYLEFVSNQCQMAPFAPECAVCWPASVLLGGDVTASSDPGLDLCPAGDAPFHVILRTAAKSPVVGDTSLRLTLENCNAVRQCDNSLLPTTVRPIAPTDANGLATFFLEGRSCDQACQAVLRWKGRVFGTVPVRSFDVDGDSVVTLSGDWDTTSLCIDFNGNGSFDFNDENLFAQHLGHGCATAADPCQRIGTDFLLNPSENLDSGTVVNISLAIANNNTSLSCNIGWIDFFVSSFGTGGTDSLLHSMAYNHTFRPGEVDTTPSFQHKIPNWGARCLKARFVPSCCGTQIEVQECYDAHKPCRPDASYCYHFMILLTEATRQCWRIVDLDFAAGWQIIDLRPGGFPYGGTSGPDSIDYLICTPNNPVLGDTGSASIYVENYSGRMWRFVNRVVVTSNTGDANGDCYIDVSDAVYIIAYIFSGGPAPVPYEAGDVNCDDYVDISDAVYLIAYIFLQGAPPCIVSPDLFWLDAEN